MIAPSLLGESLALQLTSQDDNLEIILDKKDINGLPKLILFCLEEIELSNSIKLEIQKLKEIKKLSSALKKGFVNFIKFIKF